jgi:flagellar biosynthesis protein FliQ
MTDTEIMHIAAQAMIFAAKVSAPLLLTALIVGFVISLFQTLTSIQEPTLSFVPKIAAVGLVALLAGNWMIGQTVAYTQQLFEQIPQLLDRM